MKSVGAAIVTAGLVAGAAAWPAAAARSGAQAPIRLTAGMVIDRSTVVAPGTYRLPSASLDAPAVIVRGSGITVDLTGVTLEGGEPFADPDRYDGVGIFVDGGADVTLQGGAIRGYKVGVRAAKVARLHITGVDASYNYKPRLWSGIEHESLVDWMSYHQNEHDEWLRYGAGIYAVDCEACAFDRNTIVQGENGLMLTRAARAQIWNNTFSYNSAIGIGLYRVTDSAIDHNRVDYNVRGFSDGFYFRGQDSAAILMYEQSSRNRVMNNSATHSGDGLFLWAGQTTMDTGQGGANDNQFVYNDFSDAVTNGIEATFSRNTFLFNRVENCWHGVWGGYSYDSEWTGNTFAGNVEHIAIEHGQHNVIRNNRFTGGDVGIRLWANASQDPNWGYAKVRDTASHDYQIVDNEFTGVKQDLQTLRTSNFTVRGADTPPRPVPTVADTRADGMNAKLPADARQGRSTIVVDEWGPYDYRSPKLWPVGTPTDRPLKLRILGPAGRWRLRSIRGGQLSPDLNSSGVIPAWPAAAPVISVTRTGTLGDLEVVMEYVGGEVTSPRGEKTPAGTPYTFKYTQLAPTVAWRVRAWTFDEASDPIAAPQTFAALLAKAPAKTFTTPRLDYMSGGVLVPELPGVRDRIALSASGVVTLPAGRFTLDVISDDGVKVWVDGALVIDRWSVHESVVDHAALIGGRHTIKVQYFEQTGWAELQVRFRRD